jgi:hypothetical protein
MRTRPSTLLLLSVLTGAGTAQARTYDIKTEMQHQTGSPAGGAWRASCSNCSLFATYGPNVTNLPLYEDIIALTSFYPPSTSSVFNWTLDLVNNGSVLKTLSFSGNSQSGGIRAFIPFTLTGPHNIQVRTRIKGNGTLDQCSLLYLLTETENKVEEISPGRDQSHEVGYQQYWGNESAWYVADYDPACQNGACASKFMSYGPYDNRLPYVTGPMVAAFRLAQWYNGSDDPELATVDINAWNGTRYYTVAERTIRKSEFAGVQVMTVFPLPFVRMATDSQYQFRVRYKGHGSLVHATTKVYDPHSYDGPGCVVF